MLFCQKAALVIIHHQETWQLEKHWIAKHILNCHLAAMSKCIKMKSLEMAMKKEFLVQLVSDQLTMQKGGWKFMSLEMHQLSR